MSEERQLLERAVEMLIDLHLIAEVGPPIKGGKEASVYHCRSVTSTGPYDLALKLFRPVEHRGFRRDAIYWEGSAALRKAEGALEAAGARRLGNESFFSPPQLRRDPLGRIHKPVSGSWKVEAVRTLPMPSVVLFCSDVAKVTEFYESLAAMRRVSGDASHAVLELAGFQLVVHGLRGEPGVRADRAGQVPIRQDSYVKVCLPVASLAAARARAATLGGQVYPADKEWQARGFRACDGYDPEGNVFQVRENAA